jgi:hypothetical protein
MGKKSRSAMNITDHISKSLETIIEVKNKYLYSLMWIRIRDLESFRPWIWDKGWENSEPGSGIIIPDPQYCLGLSTLLQPVMPLDLGKWLFYSSLLCPWKCLFSADRASWKHGSVCSTVACAVLGSTCSTATCSAP